MPDSNSTREVYDFIQGYLDEHQGYAPSIRDITSVDLGLTNDQHDVTGFGDAVHRFINGAFQAGSQVTLEVQVGQNAAPQSGDPEYEGEFYVESYKPTLQTGGAVMFQARLQPADGAGPAWGTV